MAKYKTRV